VSYVSVRGVRTYYEEHGSGEPLLLMHGGTGTVETLAHQVPDLARRFRVILPERRAHGRTHDTEGDLSYDEMAADTAAFMQELGIERAHMVGHSDGANVGILLAIHRPELVGRLVAMGADTHPSGMTEETREQIRTGGPDDWDPGTIAIYKRVSPDGPEHWPVAFRKVMKMWLSQPDISAEELGRIGSPTMVVVGDHDAIDLDHAVATFRAIPGAQLFICPGTSHNLIAERPELVNRVLLEFLTGSA
jgi:pimeloyl-ACP methyl ester carboxylesterase